LTVNSGAVPDCMTVAVWSAIVMVPDRGLADVFAAAE
jgi:hypothetical protein